MTDELLYANQWNTSAQYFYEKGYYSWMEEKLSSFNTVLEIGCGTGYSTLALVEKGHQVIAIEKNMDCITQAKKLLSDKGYSKQNVIFIEGDIAEDDIRNDLINRFEFDVVICWNVGSYWNRKMIEYYLPFMLEYGLDRQQIAANPESSYSELIIWNACRLASTKGVAAHIIDRGTKAITKHTDSYYYTLKDEFNFRTIEYNNKVANSISGGGRMLSTNGNVNSEEKVDIVFVSILYK
ncbi:class I SAM-dependent methyltransferase [Longibaculum muris]|uniref:Methyltransferase family protein n=1 Tax=Longibaculum muris TaxID=1796628 RepID=A0A4R3Z9H4_9FIRM|nr:class I SAM-dependent methyltransferase [Longibaculum muris]MCR1887034.1 class I SAM-dependent methyltransferase [Longibaculum muris]TCW03065.1 methyltransferase family protein [Longibaculum muris]